MSRTPSDVIKSPKCLRVALEGFTFSIEIYRLEGETCWTLEILGPGETRHIWGEQFASDKEARDVAIHALETRGAAGFMPEVMENVVPFRRSGAAGTAATTFTQSGSCSKSS